MGYPVNGLKGKITSWGESGDDCYQLINAAIRPVDFTISANGNPQESTPLDGDNTATEYIGGLFNGEAAFSALYPLSAPVLGNTGLLTLASSYTQFCKGWTLKLDWGEQEITPQPAVGGCFRYMPGGLLNWSGTYIVRQASDTAISLPTAANGTGEAATFKLKETGVADAGFTGNIIVESYSQRVAPKDMVDVTYNFRGTGSLTSVAGTSGGPALLPAGVLDMPDWDKDGDGVPDRSLVLQVFTGRTLTVPAFLRSLDISCMTTELIRVNGVARFSDAPVLA